MSADRQTIVYHLVSNPTPHWVSNTEDLSIPADRLVSLELEIYQGSPVGPESRHWKQVGKCPSLSDREVSELTVKYPKPERTTELSEAALAGLLKRE